MSDEQLAPSGDGVPEKDGRAAASLNPISLRTRHADTGAQQPAFPYLPSRSHAHSRIGYRADLDGLRAVAVVGVIACHLGIPFFQGGFVGVDVFFVLSGFLITSIIAEDLDRNRFSLADFYDRRLRRIAPALFVVLFVSAVLALIILLPHALKEFSRSLLTAAFSVSNIWFASEGGYFDPEAETLPLLHTWSLGVEEQYYALFPLLMLAVYRRDKTRLSMWIWGLFALSLAASIYATWEWPRTAFFQLPMRAWELLVGSVIALRLVPQPSARWQREAAAALGLVAIIAAVLLYTPATRFPGAAALIPCVGAGLIIWAGTGAPEGRGTWTAFILGARLPVFIGLISYSLYLWHWPLIVFVKELTMEPLTLEIRLWLVAATTVLATLTWLYVERSARAGHWPLQTPRRRVVAAAVSLTAVATLALSMYLTKGMPYRFAPEVHRMAMASNDESPQRERCHFDGSFGNTLAETCVLGASVQPEIAVFADSHGVEISAALAEMANARGLSVREVTASSCPPVVGIRRESRPECDEYIAAILPQLVAARPMTVVLGAFYFSWYDNPDETASLWAGFTTTVQSLRSAGHSIVILGAVPPQPHGLSIPNALAKWVSRGKSPKDYRFTLDTAVASAIDTKLRSIAAEHGTLYVPVIPYLCPEGDRCQPFKDGTVFYFDGHHLSMSGARRIARELMGPHVFGEAAGAAR